jgi:hypothetical protein
MSRSINSDVLRNVSSVEYDLSSDISTNAGYNLPTVRITNKKFNTIKEFVLHEGNIISFFNIRLVFYELNNVIHNNKCSILIDVYTEITPSFWNHYLEIIDNNVLYAEPYIVPLDLLHRFRPVIKKIYYGYINMFEPIEDDLYQIELIKC